MLVLTPGACRVTGNVSAGTVLPQSWKPTSEVRVLLGPYFLFWPQRLQLFWPLCLIFTWPSLLVLYLAMAVAPEYKAHPEIEGNHIVRSLT